MTRPYRKDRPCADAPPLSVDTDESYDADDTDDAESRIGCAMGRMGAWCDACG